MRYGFDLVVDLRRAIGIEHVALNPGPTFRGLHDSLVTDRGNQRAEPPPARPDGRAR